MPRFNHFSCHCPLKVENQTRNRSKELEDSRTVSDYNTRLQHPEGAQTPPRLSPAKMSNLDNVAAAATEDSGDDCEETMNVDLLDEDDKLAKFA